MAAATLLIGGCASPPAKAPWRIEPALRVDHGGAASFAAGHVALARYYEGEGRHEPALRSWREAAKLAPADADILNGFGVALARSGELGEAVVTLRKAVALAPAKATALNNLGYALLMADEQKEAAQLFARALEADPANLRARENLAALEVAGEKVAGRPVEQEAPAAASAARGAVSRPEGTLAMNAGAPIAVLSAPTLPPFEKIDASVERPAVERLRPPLSLQPAAAPAPAPVALASLLTIASAAATPEAASLADGHTDRGTVGGPAAQRTEISNGNGVSGMAAWLAGWLRERGVGAPIRLTNQPSFVTPTTVVQYRPGFAAGARALARGLPASVELAPALPEQAGADVRIVIGHDWKALMASRPVAATEGAVKLAAR